MPRKARIDAPEALHHILYVEGLNEGGYFTTMPTEMILLSGSALSYQTHQRHIMPGRFTAPSTTTNSF